MRPRLERPLWPHGSAYIRLVGSRQRRKSGFLINFWDRGLPWYAEHFRGAPQHALAGEATPSYLYSDLALERIAVTLPNVRLLVILRQPAERTWSHYWFIRMWGAEGRSFRRAINAELRNPKALPPAHKDFGFGYLGGSRYSARLEVLFSKFAREQVAILFFEDLRANPAGIFEEACRHCGLASQPVPAADRENPTVATKLSRLQWLLYRLHYWRWPTKIGVRLARWNMANSGYPSLADEDRAWLNSIYAEDLKRLEQVLQRPLPADWWD